MLAWASIACVAVGAALPFTPLAGWFHFQPLPPLYFLVLGAMVVIYLGLVETAKFFFYRRTIPAKPLSVPLDAQSRRAHRIATRWWRNAEAR
ncbi:MAG: hypothetical protein ACHP7H_06020 [Hyphomicrobiales bacterium]